jgi:outer membrane protein assembly factor BamB
MRGDVALAGLASVLLGLTSVTAVRGGDWPQFRGPGSTGVGDETGLPLHWSATEGLRWKADLPGRGVSNPVIVGGRVYVTASSGYRQDRLHVLCLDARTGRKQWERQFWATGSTTSNAKTCMAGPTPVADGERVYALFASGDLVCLDAGGNLLWYRALVQDYPLVTNQVGMAASPVLVKDVLIVPLENVGDSFVAGLDRLTGRNLWKHARARDINWCSPLVVESGGRAEVLFQSRRELTAYDPETGAERWSLRGQELADVPSPAPGRDGVLVTAPAEVLALKPPAAGAAGPEVVWKSARLRHNGTTPLAYRGRVYAVGSANTLVWADAADGKVLGQQRLGLEGQVWASPVASDGKLYVVNEAGTTAVVEAGDRPRVLATNAVDEDVLATPALADGALFLRSDRHLYCVGGKDAK